MASCSPARVAGLTAQALLGLALALANPAARAAAAENAVWFKAAGPRGPWVVAASVPAVIYTIPPSSPLHDLTYLKIYAVEDDTVYVGCTPGYHGNMDGPR